MAGKNRDHNGDPEEASDHEDNLVQAQAHVYKHTFSYISSMALKCSVELGIPDIIHKNHNNRPITLSELLHGLQIPNSKSTHLSRLMRLLVHSGFFSKQKIHGNQAQGAEEEEGYVLTASSNVLLKDNPSSLSSFLVLVLDPFLLLPWQCLGAWFKRRDDDHMVTNAFETAHGKSFWNYATEHPEICSLFNEAMAGDSKLVASVLVTKYKAMFEGLRSVVDVGGGTGIVGRAIAETFPQMKCYVLDLPHVVASCQGTENLEFIGGDMFESIPSADAILLKWILHNWNDEDCVKILKLCKEAMVSQDKKGKVIIIDVVLDVDVKEGTHESFETLQLFFDLQMMVDLVGKERTKHEWEMIFVEAGFTFHKITPGLGFRSIIEVFP